MSYYYGDLLRDYENLFTKGFKGGVPLSIKVKSSPSDKTHITQKYRLSRSVETKDDVQVTSYNVANGATLKTSCHDNAVASKLKFGNGGLTYEVGYKPSEWNNAEKALQLKHSSVFNALSRQVDSTESLKVGAPKVGPLRLWATLDLAWNNVDNKKAIKASGNVNFEHYHVGGKVEHDITDNKTTKINVLGLLKNSKGDFFLAGDIKKNTYTLGCHHHHGEKSEHGVEVVFDGTRKQKGVCGQPATINWAGLYQISADATLRTKLTAADTWNLGFSWSHRINDHLKVGFSEDLNLCSVFSGCCGSAKKCDTPF
jgi:hypothetical protein